MHQAFFQTDKRTQGVGDILNTPSDADSVDASNFNYLLSDNIVSNFGQISPSIKVQEIAPETNIKDYGYEAELGFDEPIIRSGSLELPKYDPKKNYFESYWRLYMKNEQLLNQIGHVAETRDSLLKGIL